MAHQFNALHGDGFVRVSHKTRERLREVNVLALGLVTEMSAHVDGYPVTLNDIIKRAAKPGEKLMRDAYQDLINERLVVFIQYTLQLPGARPYPSSTTLIAQEAITDAEFAEHVTDRFRPGATVLDRQKDGEVRKVTVLAARVRYWKGEWKLDEEGQLSGAAPRKKSGPKAGAKDPTEPQSSAASTTQHDDAASSLVNVEPTAPSPTNNGFVEPTAPSPTMTSTDAASSQVNVEPTVLDSTTRSLLTRRENKNNNQTKDPADEAASPPEPHGSEEVGLVGEGEPQTEDHTAADERATRYLRQVSFPNGTGFARHASSDASLVGHVASLLDGNWSEDEITAAITDADGATVRSWPAFARRKLDALRPKSAEPVATEHVRLWCGDCDQYRVEYNGRSRAMCAPTCPNRPYAEEKLGYSPARSNAGQQEAGPASSAEVREAEMAKFRAAVNNPHRTTGEESAGEATPEPTAPTPGRPMSDSEVLSKLEDMVASGL